MRHDYRVNFSEQRKKEIARRHYAERQIDQWVKWSYTVRGKILWREFMEKLKQYNLDG